MRNQGRPQRRRRSQGRVIKIDKGRAPHRPPSRPPTTKLFFLFFFLFFGLGPPPRLDEETDRTNLLQPEFLGFLPLTF